MAPAPSRKFQNNAVYSEKDRERRRRNGEAVTKFRTKERARREKIPAEIFKLFNQNYFLAGQIKANLKTLDVYRNNAETEDLWRSEEFYIKKLLRDSNSILVRYEISSV